MSSTPIPTPIYADNDYFWLARLKDVDPATAKVIPLASGTVTAFLSTTDGSDGSVPVAADAALVGTCTQVSAGKWLIAFDAGVLTNTRMNTAFGAAPTACYLIVIQAGGIRTVADLIFTKKRAATIA